MKSPSRALLIVVAILVVSETTSFSFLRSYSDYSVTSANGRYVAEIRWKNDVGTLRAYQAGKMSRKFLWEISIPTPTSERVHLSDDGRFLVLEENYPYTDDALEFYDSGRLVKTIRQLYPQEQARKPSNSPDNLCVPRDGANTSSSICLNVCSI